MLEFLNFIFRDFKTYFGFLFIFLLFSGVIINILKFISKFRFFDINKNYILFDKKIFSELNKFNEIENNKKEDKNKTLLEELIKIWNQNNNN